MERVILILCLNLFVLICYVILYTVLRQEDISAASGAMILQLLVNIGLTIAAFAQKNWKLGKALLLNLLIIAIIGASVCATLV